MRYSRHITRKARWLTMRAAILERDNHACVKCGVRGRLEVDHIHPVRTHPGLAWEPSNLQALCPRCHSEKTNLETGRTRTDPRRQAWKTLLRQTQRKSSSRKDDKCLIQ
ncbi:MAG: HNH endonuclease [Pseudooceanicola sp.]|nr:HNH endonuclease [Pseudooceanicola sp.]